MVLTFKSLSTGVFYVSFGIGIQPNTSGFVAIHHLGRSYENIYYQNRMNITFSLTKNYILNSTIDRPDFYIYSFFDSLHSSKIYETYMSVLILGETKPFSFISGKNVKESNNLLAKVFLIENI